MSHAHPAATDAANRAGAIKGTEIADLARLYDPDVMLVTAPVPPSEEAVRYATSLVDAGTRRLLAEVDTPGGSPVPGALERLALHEGQDAAGWLEYLDEVTTVFAYLLGAASVGVRLQVADAPHCPRLHVDRVVARGVLTVIGAGTQWFEDANLDRSRLGHAGGADDTTSGIVSQWDQIHRVPAGTLAIFKGAEWPGAGERSIVHRSPPADGSWRVVLTLDWLD